MAVTGVTEKTFTDYCRHGGEFICLIDATDIDAAGHSEQSPSLDPLLNRGFEITPTAVIHNPTAAVQLGVGDPWTNVIAITYRNGGKIIYRRQPDGRYEARVSMPNKPSVLDER